jgi:hypothetical protein
LNWLNTTGSIYTSDTYLPSQGNPGVGAAIFWEFIDDGDDDSNSTAPEDWKIQMAVAVPATGWVAFGMSLSGGMADSDIVVYETSNPTNVSD